MGLVDRIFHEDPDPGRNMNNHEFAGALFFLSIGEATREELVALFDMTPDDEADLDLMIAHFGSLTPPEQGQFHGRVESAGMLAENGGITRTRYLAFLLGT